MINSKYDLLILFNIEYLVLILSLPKGTFLLHAADDSLVWILSSDIQITIPKKVNIRLVI